MEFLYSLIVSVFGIIVYLPWKFVYVGYQVVVMPFQLFANAFWEMVIVISDTWASLGSLLAWLPMSISVGIMLLLALFLELVLFGIILKIVQTLFLRGWLQ